MTERVRTLWLLAFAFFCALAGGARAICPTGYALEFDGIDDYINMGNDSSLKPDLPVIISAWIKLDEINRYHWIISTDDRVSMYYGTWFYVEVNNKLVLGYGDGGIKTISHRRSKGGVTELLPDTWYHVAGVIKSPTDMDIYVNGIEDGGGYEGSGGPLAYSANGDIYVGTDSSGYLYNLDGIIDEVMIFDRALSAEEIKQVYCGNIDPCDSDLAGYWEFDEGTGQQAYDSTANSNDGQLGNSPFIDLHDPNWVLSDITPMPDYYVDDDWANDPGPGDPCVSDPNEDGSIDHPFDNIQEAIDFAYADCNSVCCPVIMVRDGRYDGMGNYDIDTLGMSVTIKSEHGPWYTVIDPHGQGRGFIITKGETKCTLIDGFTIFDGYAKPVQLYGQSAIVGGGIFCNAASPTIRNCTFSFNYAEHSGGGIFLHDSNAVIERCELIYNDSEVTGGGIVANEGAAVIQNCLIAHNNSYYSGGISCSLGCNATITNCTIADNRADQWNGVRNLECVGANAHLTNSILWTRTEQSFWWQSDWYEPIPNQYEEHILIEPWSGYPASLSVSYSDLEWGMEAIYNPDTNATLDWQVGNINTYPLFADSFFADYHLKSGVGRWTIMFESNGDYNNDWFIDFGDFAIFALYWIQPNPPVYIDLDNDGYLDVNDLGIFCSRWLGPGENFSGWVQDDSNSFCIDAGDPCSPYLLEPAPNGGRVNMGAYGNTEQASKSTVVLVPRRHPDMDDDGDVDFVDFAYFAKWWLYVAPGIPADFDYSGFVNEADLQEFCLWWLWGK